MCKLFGRFIWTMEATFRHDAGAKSCEMPIIAGAAAAPPPRIQNEAPTQARAG